MKKDEFDKDKADGKLVTSLNKVPFLEVDGVTIPQSKSMEVIARRFNMTGSNDLEAAQIDAIWQICKGFYDAYQKRTFFLKTKRMLVLRNGSQ